MTPRYSIAANGNSYLFDGHFARILVSGAQTNGLFAVVDGWAPKGRATPAHVHANEDETFYVLEGAVRYDLPGGGGTLGPGAIVTLPRRVPHRLANVGEGSTRHLVIATPAGFDDFVREAGVPVADLSGEPPPLDADGITRLAAAAQRHAISLLPAVPDTPATEPPATASAPRETFETLGPVCEVLTEVGTGDGAVAVLHVTFAPGVVLPLHTHREPECFFVLEGRLDAYIAGTWHSGGPGDALVIDAHARHAFRNAGTAQVVALAIMPVTLLDFLRGFGAPPGAYPPGPPPPERLQRLLDLAIQRGDWFAAPEDNVAIGLPSFAGG